MKKNVGIYNQNEDININSSFGDMSSIMITPDQIFNNFNLMDDDDNAAVGGDKGGYNLD